MPGTDPVSTAIERFRPRSVSAAAAGFAKQVTTEARPQSPERAKAFLFAASRLGTFGEAVGLELVPEVLLDPSVIERFVVVGCARWSGATRRTLRANLRALAASVRPGPAAPRLSRERAKEPYSADEIAAYLALADAQPTEGRRQRAGALICLGAGAGLVGADLKAVRGTDVTSRSGGVVVCVGEGRRPRVVPVLARHHEHLLAAAAWAGGRLLIGGTATTRRNVTSPLTASLAGGTDLPRIEISRLRATWLCEVAQAIGLRAFMDAAGITCSQRLGDLLCHVAAASEHEAVALLGGRR
jgi:integrase